jgi:hypothetical protein
MDGLSYSLGASGEVLHLSASALKHMIGHAQIESTDVEAGGQLFANISKKEIKIVRATGPNIEDQRNRFYFRICCYRINRGVYARGHRDQVSFTKYSSMVFC